MKKTRRQELKTNELSVYLQQIYEAAARNATYLIGGVAVVVLVLVVGLLVQRNRHRAETEAWNRYSDIRAADAAADPDLLDRARSLVADSAGLAGLEPLALELQASKVFELALSKTAPGDRERRIELLKASEDTYEQLLRKVPDRPDVAARARMGLAKVQESLIVAGQGSKERVRELYQQVINAAPNPYQAAAKAGLEDLDIRLAPLEIVATRPAEEPPAARPPATTEPAATTRPAATTPPAQGTQPATAPASAPA